MKYMKNVGKALEKSGISVGKSAPPSYWVSTGNYAQNKIISGSFNKGVPQGRITAFAGPSGAGKSFNIANLMREAQAEGCFVVAIDSENALSEDFVQKLGVSTDEDEYLYIEVNTVSQCKRSVSNIVNSYKKENELNDPDSDKLFIAIDSLNMMMTDAEEEQFTKGESKGDMGQKNKQLKAMLQSFTNAIKGTNIIIVLTSQVYENPDFPMNGKPRYIFPPAVEYCCSQIVMVTRLMMKDKTTKEVLGVRMKCEGQKTRFCKPFQSMTMLVPYDAGMDPYSGLLEIAIANGIVEKNGAWLTYKNTGEKFQEKTFHKVAEQILEDLSKENDTFIDAVLGEDEIEMGVDNSKTMKQQRKAKMEKQLDDAQLSDDE